MNIETSPVLSSETPIIKRGRGRPSKHITPEEKQEKMREYCRTWRENHREEYNEYNRTKYRENPDKIIQKMSGRQRMAKDAMRLLKELWAANQLQTINEHFRTMIEDLVVHNKPVYI